MEASRTLSYKCSPYDLRAQRLLCHTPKRRRGETGPATVTSVNLWDLAYAQKRRVQRPINNASAQLRSYELLAAVPAGMCHRRRWHSMRSVVLRLVSLLRQAAKIRAI
jgi:hypothetical protein